jgi:hypothetical protein
MFYLLHRQCIFSLITLILILIRRGNSPVKTVGKNSDPFDFLGGSSYASESKSDLSPKFSPGLSSGHQAMSDSLRNKLESLPRSSPVDKVLSADQFIRASTYTVILMFYYILPNLLYRYMLIV